MIQVTLKKDNGSFGMVIRGGGHEIHRKSRPFTVVQVTANGPTFLDGTIRTGDRVITVNGQDIRYSNEAL
jgi:C-terminal processing protease CtpA/Prc